MQVLLISSLGAMAEPQLLHPIMAVLLLLQLSPGEDLCQDPHHGIILKYSCDCYCQYSLWGWPCVGGMLF